MPRAGIKTGAKWTPWDQIDYIIGGLALGWIIFFPGWRAVVILLVAGIVLHKIVSIIGYDLGLRRHPW